jgi:hypothetical protein
MHYHEQAKPVNYQSSILGTLCTITHGSERYYEGREVVLDVEPLHDSTLDLLNSARSISGNVTMVSESIQSGTGSSEIIWSGSDVWVIVIYSRPKSTRVTAVFEKYCVPGIFFVPWNAIGGLKLIRRPSWPSLISGWVDALAVSETMRLNSEEETLGKAEVEVASKTAVARDLNNMF